MASYTGQSFARKATPILCGICSSRDKWEEEGHKKYGKSCSCAWSLLMMSNYD